MISSISTRSRGTRRTALLALASVLVLTAGSAVAMGDEGRDKSLEGTWRVQVTTQDCTTATPFVTFQAMLTFVDGGTMTGTTTNPGFLAGQRSGDHGVWKRTGHNTYRALSEAFVLFDSPALPPPAPVFHKGVQRLVQAIRVQGPDRFTSNATVGFFDPAGNVLVTGCASAVGTRMK